MTWPENPGSTKPAVAWVSSPEPAEAGLALDPRGDVVGQGDVSRMRPEDELARVQDQRLAGVDLDEAGQVGLVLGRVDVGVLVVVEQPEVLVEPHVDARRLEHRRLPRVQDDPAALDLGADVAVGEQHGHEGSRSAAGRPSAHGRRVGLDFHGALTDGRSGGSVMLPVARA